MKLNQKTMSKTAEENFCKTYTEFYGEPIDNIEQLVEHRFTGKQLMEFCEFFASQHKSNSATSRELFVKLFAENLVKHHEEESNTNLPDELLESLNSEDGVVMAVYDTCLEFSTTCNELAEKKFKELEKEIKELRECLSELVELKKMKDKEGKTFIYCDRKPKAWKTAFELIESLNKNKGE